MSVDKIIPQWKDNIGGLLPTLGYSPPFCRPFSNISSSLSSLSGVIFFVTILITFLVSWDSFSFQIWFLFSYISCLSYLLVVITFLFHLWWPSLSVVLTFLSCQLWWPLFLVSCNKHFNFSIVITFLVRCDNLSCKVW